MAILYSVVAVVGLIAALDLLLTVGVIRRLREHTDILAGRGTADGPPPSVMLGPDETVRPFAAADIAGEAITEDVFRAGPTLVGVFAQGCSSCEERLPHFLDYARQRDTDQVLSIVIGDAAHDSRHVRELQEVGRVVVEDRPGAPMSTALGVKGYPAFAVVGTDGTVRASGTLLEHALA
jgi:hypothetical protein